MAASKKLKHLRSTSEVSPLASIGGDISRRWCRQSRDRRSSVMRRGASPSLDITTAPGIIVALPPKKSTRTARLGSFIPASRATRTAPFSRNTSAAWTATWSGRFRISPEVSIFCRTSRANPYCLLTGRGRNLNLLIRSILKDQREIAVTGIPRAVRSARQLVKFRWAVHRTAPFPRARAPSMFSRPATETSLK